MTATEAAAVAPWGTYNAHAPGWAQVVGVTCDGEVYCPGCADALAIPFDGDGVGPVFATDEVPDYWVCGSCLAPL